jgi:hypothetical protein
MSEKKKVDIFSLYEREKKLTLSDNENTVDVLFVKMTQGELDNALEIYNKIVREEREKIKNDTTILQEIKDLIDSFTKDEIIEALTSAAKFYRESELDKFPIDDENVKTEEDKKLYREKLLKDWEITYREELKKEEKETLSKRLVNLRIESLIMMRAVSCMNNYSLSVMVRDVDTKERIFKNVEDVLKIKDRRVMDKLLTTLNEFTRSVNEKTVREVSQSTNFTPAGQSLEK